jgi:ATPase subunit of ABC transporter with duplicated ATPase domains
MPVVMELLAVDALGVSKRYGERVALADVHRVVKARQLHGLLGPNGAGKTTLLRILLGLVARDAGTVRLLGRDLRSRANRSHRALPGSWRPRRSTRTCPLEEITSAFNAWHGVLAEPRFYGALAHGAIVSGVHLVLRLALAYRILQRRDIGG